MDAACSPIPPVKTLAWSRRSRVADAAASSRRSDLGGRPVDEHRDREPGPGVAVPGLLQDRPEVRAPGHRGET
jgi:hypothetical protein